MKRIGVCFGRNPHYLESCGLTFMYVGEVTPDEARRILEACEVWGCYCDDRGDYRVAAERLLGGFCLPRGTQRDDISYAVGNVLLDCCIDGSNKLRFHLLEVISKRPSEFPYGTRHLLENMGGHLKESEMVPGQHFVLYVPSRV